MAEEGADVVVCDIAAQIPAIKYPMAALEQLDETVELIEKYGVRGLGLVADMRDTGQVETVVDRVMADFGRVDILVANHGVVAFSTVENTSDEDWTAVVDTNLTGTFKMMRAVIPHMKSAGYGRIVATSSMGARDTHPNLPHYTSSKWAIIGLVKGCALELADTGITANVVCPAAVGTDLFFNQPTYEVFCPDLEHPTRADFEQRLVEHRHGLNGRPYLESEHVTRAVMYLVTDADGVLTGQVMDVGLGSSAAGIA
jgi:NAD(P)-dependent dehydrogenase (short-subunit alcohol dehydrogenase family)